MRKILLLFLIVSLNSMAQDTYKGKLFDKKSNESLPYVNIGVVGKNMGTVSDFNGNFKITLDKKYDNDTLKISMIGYKPLIYKVSNFKELLRKNSSLQMEEEITELEEFVVSSKELKEKVLGNKTTSQMITGGFSSNKLGNEVGIRIKIKKSPTYIQDFNVSIVNNEFDSVKFRLNIYDLKDGLPNEIILKENIIVVTKMKSGILTVDLDKYNIVVHDDFFISLEWIEDLGDSGGLTFSAGFLGNPIIIRSTSQDSWDKIGGISMGLNVTAKY